VANILVCDDERSICQVLDMHLRGLGHRVETVNSAEAAVRKIDTALYDVIITDVRMPGAGGMGVLRHARSVSPETATLLISGNEDFNAAVEAMRLGASDYIIKTPEWTDEIELRIAKLLDSQSLRRQNVALRRDAATRNSLDNIIGASAAMQKLKETIRAVASTQSTVVVHGESGTGKELVARALHSCSPRAGAPFVPVNCGAFPETLLESELFGYVKGAFTGATQNSRGLFEGANGGTIFLDEVSEMSLAMQVKLLRALQERTIRPVGGTEEVAVDVRVIAATNKELEKLVSASAFREDLYYRLSVIPVQVPPLRDRREDIPLLANHFLKKYAPAAGKSILRVSPAALDALRLYDWPGNVRELENTVERAVALETTDELRVDLPPERRARAAAAVAAAGGATAMPSAIPAEGIDLEASVASIERSLIQMALRQSGGVQTKAADLLKLSYRSFRHLLKKYDI
jgi:two-component system response regulator PilR (NtrC family)